MRQPNPTQFTTKDTEDTETKAFLRVLSVLRGELISILSSIAASPRQFQKSHKGHRARQVATQRARRPSRHHTSPRVRAFFQPDGPPQLADQPARFAGTRFGLALRAVPSARHLRAVALRLCRAAAARSVPSVTKQTPQKTFRISCRQHPPLVAASPHGFFCHLCGGTLPFAKPRKYKHSHPLYTLTHFILPLYTRTL
jgi:hypothetical protein